MTIRERELFEVPLPPTPQVRGNGYAYRYARQLPWATEADRDSASNQQQSVSRQKFDPGMPIHASTGPNLLDANQVAIAIQRNQQFATQLWPGLRTPISIYYLRFYRSVPDDREFAQAVARWQYAVGNLHVNGQLDASTWHIMRTRGEPHAFTTPDGVVRPSSYHEMLATFGNPQQDRERWEKKNIVHVNAPSGYNFRVEGGSTRTVRAHRLLKKHLECLFEVIAKVGLWDAIQPVSGPYNFRNVRGGTRLSTHAFGISIDIKPDEYARGQKEHFPGADVVHVFQDYGFHWGMFWGHPDPMHFQFAIGT